MGNKKSIEEVVESFITVHNHKYDYSEFKYINTDTKGVVICPEHGRFEITPYHHIHRKQGCPECGKIKCQISRKRNTIEKRKVTEQPDDYKLVYVGKGRFAKVDNEDFEKVRHLTWCTSHGYAYNFNIGKMHRYIMDYPENLHIDHINHDKLDNRRRNLRLATQQENSFNSRARKQDKTSKYKGVWFSSKSKKWVSDITKDGKKRRVGTFNTEEEAGKAYDRKALELFGEFAYLNFKV